MIILLMYYFGKFHYSLYYLNIHLVNEFSHSVITALESLRISCSLFSCMSPNRTHNITWLKSITKNRLMPHYAKEMLRWCYFIETTNVLLKNTAEFVQCIVKFSIT